MNRSEYDTRNFSRAEFEHSDLAVRNGIDNQVPDELLSTMARTFALGERIRSVFNDRPMTLTSGYRCLELNRRLGSKDTSDHVKACAIDFVIPSYGPPLEVATMLALWMHQGKIYGIGQLIHEYGRWVHVSSERPADPDNAIITIDALGTRPGIWPARSKP